MSLQEIFKNLIIGEYGLLSPKKVELITQMGLATLFFLRSAQFYLSDNELIALVMPRSVFVVDQHHIFRSGLFIAPKLGFVKFIDLEKVEPLFKVPSCVIFAKLNHRTAYPVDTTVIEGKLKTKNEKLAGALRKLNIRHTKLELRNIGKRTFLTDSKDQTKLSQVRSDYYDMFRNGATIYPKSFWCVDFSTHPKLGIDPRYPNVITSKRAMERGKLEYGKVALHGNVESQFLYGVVSGSELVPFGLTGTYLTVLPIEEDVDGFSIVSRVEAVRKGYQGLADWLGRVEKLWREKRGEKASRMDVYNRLDYQRNLTSQNLRRRFKVLYNTSGTYLVSCVVENKPIRIAGTKINVNGVIADWKTYWMETDDENEAYYMSAILNLATVDEVIKPMQSKGAFGERDIVKKPLELPIPRFNPNNQIHTRLTQISKECHEKVQQILPALTNKYKSIGKIRSEIKKHLEKELKTIDELTKQILKQT